jgi:predicted  nucleic acid-binding Zn-ribbon protein
MAKKVTDALADALEDGSLVERLLRGAEKELQTGREEAARLKRAISEVEGRIGRLTATLSDPDTDPAARSALTREIGKYEAERERALKELDRLREDAEVNVEELAASVRDVLADAKENLAKASPQEFHDIIGGLVGPLVIGKDGSVCRMKHAPEEAPGACVPYVVAGAGFEPATSGL